MNGLLRLAQFILALLVLSGLCLALFSVPSCQGSIINISETAVPTPTPTPEAPPAPPPPSGECDNIGVSYPQNPFAGWPVSGGPSWGRVTAVYCDPLYYEEFGVNHLGIDLGYPLGTPILATGQAAVQAAGWHDEMGFYVRICAVNGWCASYKHLSNVAVDVGDIVFPGTWLGNTGNSGNSTGPHLHYEIRDNGYGPVDPAPTM